MRNILPFVLLALAACGGAEPVPGGVSADEAAALNDAAMMLDANSVSADQIDNEEAEE
ncbi:hypothetical protein [Sphingomonas sp. AX6]|uniref:hypothetical protein n=1 Tax=Sphingomonas sp. AX6 TaxID=2653171 RepID=UPI0012F08AAF|nr:hypothetical protein [Sphingomonas sp. AX6]VXC79389.1 conserved hypothetical protein [Sphingomonas sp. AX6]